MNDENLNQKKNYAPQNNQLSLLGEASVLTSVLNQVSDGVYITDPERSIVFWNEAAEKITGYRQEEVLGKRCAENLLEHTDLAGNKLCSTELCPLYKAIQSGKTPPAPLTIKALNKKGERIVVEVSIAPLYLPSGEVLGGIEIFRDISDKVELEEQKARFFSSLSHELKTPLANMHGYLDLLLKRDAGDINEVQEEFLTTIYNEEQKLAGYIEELLDMGRFEGTDYSYQRNILDLSTLLENLVCGFSAEAGEKGLGLDYSIQPGLTLFGDKERLTQAFSNLVGNAIKYTEAGSVNLEAGFNRETDEILITVSDSGMGIPEEEQNAIFDIFYRCEHSQPHSKRGTGVGLYIVERVVRRHDGRLYLKSEPGKGSIFTVYLPGFIREGGQ